MGYPGAGGGGGESWTKTTLPHRANFVSQAFLQQLNKNFVFKIPTHVEPHSQ